MTHIKALNVFLLVVGTAFIIAGVVTGEWVLAVPGDVLVVVGVLLFFLYVRERPAAPVAPGSPNDGSSGDSPTSSSSDQPPHDPAS